MSLSLLLSLLVFESLSKLHRRLCLPSPSAATRWPPPTAGGLSDVNDFSHDEATPGLSLAVRSPSGSAKCARQAVVSADRSSLSSLLRHCRQGRCGKNASAISSQQHRHHIHHSHQNHHCHRNLQCHLMCFMSHNSTQLQQQLLLSPLRSADHVATRVHHGPRRRRVGAGGQMWCWC